MTGWTRVEGRAVALAQENIDTDQLIPARFMSALEAFWRSRVART